MSRGQSILGCGAIPCLDYARYFADRMENEDCAEMFGNRNMNALQIVPVMTAVTAKSVPVDWFMRGWNP
jgi:hypothetical protein